MPPWEKYSGGAPVAPQGIPIGPQDPAAVYRGPAAAVSIQSQQSNMQNDAIRVALAQQEAARAAEKAARDRQSEADKQRTLDARGGLETTEGERKSAFLATRLAGGLRDLTGLGNIGAPSLKDALAGGTLLGNYTTDEDRQRAIYAQMEILDPALTLGTGAAYNKEQLESYRKTYFPQPGDQPKTIQDKNRRLQTLLNAARISAGASGSMIDEALAPLPASKDAGSRPGTTVQDGGEYDEQGNFLGLAGGVTDEGPGGGSTPPQPDFRDSYAGQVNSGLNGGVANVIGAPVDITTAALNLGSRGINALTNSDLPAIEKPFLGSEYLKDKMGGWAIYDQSKDPNKQFARRVAESVGSAIIPAAATSSRFAQAAKAIGVAAGGGIGAATAQRAFPGNPVAEFAGEMAGSGLTAGGLLGSANRAARRQIEMNVPTIPQLKDQAGQLYRQAESRGITANEDMTTDLGLRLRGFLEDKGRITPDGQITEVYPKVKEAIRLTDGYAGRTMTPTQMQPVRSVIADGLTSKDPTETYLARNLTGIFDEWANPQAPELAQARNISSRYLNAEKLEKARELARTKESQFTNSGPENALRTAYRQLDRNSVQGGGRYGADVTEAIQRVNRGTPMSNAARAIGKAAPTSPMAITLGMASPTAVGTMMGGPTVGAALGAGTAGAGLLGRLAATRMTDRAAELAELTARNGGALAKPLALDPETQSAVSRALLAIQPQYLTEEEKKRRKR